MEQSRGDGHATNTDPVPQQSSSSEVRIPELDGFRGLAILLVLLFHFTPDYEMSSRALEWLKKAMLSGWVGVDLFFVLSGFLITDILLNVRRTPGWIKVFYWRRALRIAPLYFVALAVVFLMLPFFFPEGTHPGFDQQRDLQLWFWAHAANIIMLLNGFDGINSDVVNLDHLWSLAVEEHFYFFWPFVVGALGTRRLGLALLAMFGLALLLRGIALLTLEGQYLNAAYFQTFTRMDGLASGAMVAVLLRTSDGAKLRLAALLLLPCVVAPLLAVFLLQKGLWLSSPFVRTFGLTLLPISFGCVLVIVLSSHQSTLVRRVLASFSFRFFGKYSYGIYIIHGLLTPALDHLMPDRAVLEFVGSEVGAIAVVVGTKSAISVLLALISWHLLEIPFLRLKNRCRYATHTPNAAAPMTI